MDMEKYYDITSELDAREILRYLNQLGIHNISGEVLKYFITDLKKLIKYELQQKNKAEIKDDYDWPERLHSATTFSSRCRSKTQTEVPYCTRECKQFRRPLIVRNIHSAPNLGQPRTAIDEGKILRRTCSCVKEKPSKDTKTVTSVTSSYNLIRVAQPPIKKKCDPVSLYHHYIDLWAKHRSKVPGENDWADLRWSIRQKMAGTSQQTISKVPNKKLKVKVPHQGK